MISISYWLFPIPYCLFPIPYGLFPIPYWLFLIGCCAKDRGAKDHIAQYECEDDLSNGHLAPLVARLWAKSEGVAFVSSNQ